MFFKLTRTNIVWFAMAFIASTLLITQLSNNNTYAIDCDGVASTEDCPLTDVGSSFTGNYRTVLTGDGIYEDNSSGSFSLTVPACTSGPATIEQATISWAVRSGVEAFWEDGITLAVDSGTGVSVLPDRQYKTYGSFPTGNFDAYYSSYTADITALGIVQPGTHTYDFSDVDAGDPTASLFDSTQWGAGIHVVYECAEFDEVEIQQKDGLDLHWLNFDEAYAVDRSQLICDEFTADISLRSATLDIFLPGAVSAIREADIWFLTGTGTAPAADAFDLLTDVNTPANGGAVLERLILTDDDPEWDSYQTNITIPVGHEYACVQIDSSFDFGDHPDDIAVSGASMYSGAAWFAVPTPAAAVTTLSLGDTVWNDENNNGIYDSGENGICGVTLQLFSDVDSSGEYTVVGDGTSPIATTATACGANEGEYLFDNLAAGDYIVVIPASEMDASQSLENYTSSTGTNGSATGAYETAPCADNDANNDDNGTYLSSVGAVSCAVTLTEDSEPTNDGDADNNTNLSVDFGFFQQAKLGDYVWIDENGNGLQDTGEEGVDGVVATLYNADTDSVVAMQTTDADGAYQFCYLVAGNYYVVFSDLPDDYYLTTNDGSDEASDSDVDPSTNRTEVFALSTGEVLPDVDGGIQQVLGDLSVTDDSLAATGQNVTSLFGVSAMLLVATGAATKKSKLKAYKVLKK